jgi:predicted HTH transcriptional regulator
MMPRKKFLSSVAAFANSSGGDLIYGMVAEKGRPIKLKALADLDADQASIRIRDLIRTGIAPTVFTAENPHAVPLAKGGEALVIRVRKTWAGAHMVTYNGDNRFYIRHGGGRRLMDMPEIRSAFSLAENTIERIQRFRMERLSSILSGDAPCALGDKTAIVFHIVHCAPSILRFVLIFG